MESIRQNKARMLCRCALLAYAFLVTPCAASVVGGSHNRTDATGRNRANVIYTPAKTAIQPQTEKVMTAPVPPVAEDTEIVDAVMPTVEPAEPAPDLTADIAMATEYIAYLKGEIAQIDSEIARCKKAKTGWTIGTIVGSVGVVGTATGAIVQAVQINKAKKNDASE